MLRGHLERGIAAHLHPHPIMHLPNVRFGIPDVGFGVAVSHTHRHETRRHQNGQIGETHDTDRRFFHFVHGPGDDRHRLSLLRTIVLRRLDGHVDSRHVQPARVCRTLSFGG